MKILFINPPLRENVSASHIPLGLAYVMTKLYRAGYDIHFYDMDIKRDTHEVMKYHLTEKKEDYEFIFVGGLITLYGYYKNYLSQVLMEVYPNTRKVIGGAIASVIPELLLKNTCFDIAVIGEAEHTVLDLMAGIPLKNINGIAYKEKENIIVNKPRALMQNIDGMPDRSFFNVEKYMANAFKVYHCNHLDIVISRGCPYNCNFCYDIFGKKVRLRSINDVIKELSYLKKAYNLQMFTIVDETFMLNEDYVIEFCRKLKKLNLSWTCNSRVNLINDKIAQAISDAGCKAVLFGIESGSQKVLDIMKKGVKVIQADKAIDTLRKYNINPICSMMVGSLGETKETIQESVDFCARNNVFINSFFITTPNPKSNLYNHCIKAGLIKDEDEYLENLVDFEKLHINLTNMSDEELLLEKKKAEKRILYTYVISNPLMVIKKIIRKLTMGYG